MDETAPTDQQLHARIQAGDEHALVLLHRRYARLVFSFALHVLGDRAEAEEVTQDVFLKVWRQPTSYDPDRGRFSSWLLTVTRHAAIDRLRLEGRRPALSTRSPQDDRSAPSMSGAREQTAGTEGPDLRLALRELPEEQRVLIELAYFGGMSQQDLADVLELPLGTVKTRMRLGMAKLRRVWRGEA